MAANGEFRPGNRQNQARAEFLKKTLTILVESVATFAMVIILLLGAVESSESASDLTAS
jgi:hypothetical protein